MPLKKKRTGPVVNPSPEQEQAIELCCNMDEKMVGVTGGAGTGKTFVLGRVHEELAREVGNGNIALCAPTGRAAKRIRELTGIEAVTIHRLLQFPTPEDIADEDEEIKPNMPRRHAGNPLTQRVLLVDESSMVSTELFDFLLDAMHSRAVIRFFGDNNQLAPVEDNTGLPPPFIAVLENEPSVTLTYNFRSQDEIVGNALRILGGRMPQQNDRFTIIYDNNPIECLIDFVTKDFTRMDHQIIMPMRVHKSGTMRVNPSVQMRFNPKGEMLRLDRYDDRDPPLAVRAKDKILWTKNDYNLTLFNGEIGSIAELDAEGGSLVFETDEGVVDIPPLLKYFDRRDGRWKSYDPRRQIELGYAITTHKAQGSEFDTVVYCMSASQYYTLSRRNFYTAVTRAKNRLIIITDRRSMGVSLRKRESGK